MSPFHKNSAYIKLIKLSLILTILLYLINLTSPWPGALLIRLFFETGAAKTSLALEKHLPNNVSEISNLNYSQGDKDAYLDVFYPNTLKPAQTLPTIVWIHGGAWVSGSKDEVENYLKILSSKGYTTVSIGYALAPKKHYPLPIFQINQALKYITENSTDLHIDSSKIILAGDSAGAQLAAQTAALNTNRGYAKTLGITPALNSNNLIGTILNCGAYNISIANYNGLSAWFVNTVLWSYSGKKDYNNDPYFQTTSVINYVTGDFPPTFITVGNKDPLKNQSIEFAEKLKNLNVPLNTLFYPDNYNPPLNHEYQFNLDTPEGNLALENILTFLQKITTQ